MAAIQSQGTTLTYNAIAVGGIKSYTGFDGSAAEIDTTTLSSTAMEYQVGLQDFGNFSMEINYDTADVGQIALLAAKTAGSTNTAVLTLSDGSIATFSAFVVTFPLSGGTSEIDTSSVNLRVTGAVVWT